MSTTIKRSVLDFCATDYTTKDHKVKILNSLPKPYIPQGLSKNPNADQRDPAKDNEFIQRWYLSLQGEGTPLFSATDAAEGGQKIYRYDWTLGITLIKGHHWDWQKELREENTLAIHLLLDSDGGNAPEAFPVSATLSALNPARSTQTFQERLLPALTKTGAKTSALSSDFLPAMKYLAAGFDVGSNLLESYSGKEKNWFLYQFLDSERCCPVVEWRINKRVFQEYGPLLRGTLFLSFHGDYHTSTALRLKLRPQICYVKTNSLDFIIPTDALPDDKQVSIEVKPKTM